MAAADDRDRLKPAAAVGAAPSRETAPWLLGLACVVLMLMAAGVWVQWRQSSLMSQAMLASGDNLAHFLYQADNEYLRLRETWPVQHRQPEPSFDTLQLRYDIFVSRIEVLRDALKGRPAGAGSEVKEALRQAEAFIAQADRLLGPGKPVPDPAAVQALWEPLQSIDGALRGLTLEASRIVAAHATRVGEASRTHQRLGLGLSLLLVVMAVTMGIFVWQQLQRLHKRRRHLEVLTAELGQARQAAEAASASKSSFLANMSHEIRTPFQGLKGMLGLLAGTPLNAQQTGYLRTASASADHLLSLLNDILDMSRLESGRMALVTSPVVLRELLLEVDALMRPQAVLKSLDFTVDVDTAVPDRVLLDATRARQVLFNLVANAIKFTEQGGVTVQVRLAPDAMAASPQLATPQADVATGKGTQPPAVQVEFSICDTGIGMDAATLERLFQRFSQGDESLSRRYGGTGLGLEISRSLARLMGGDIVAQSHLGEGSCFTFSLPLTVVWPVPGEQVAPPDPVVATALPQPAAGADADADADPDASSPSPQDPDPWPSARSLRVLVAEDNEVNRMVMDAILSGMGHAVGFAENGEQALALASEQHWDIVLMDLHMPVMDGLEATQAIRSLTHAQRAAVPIVALTADVFPETRERCVEAGIQDFLTKPVDTAELASCLQRLVPPATAA